MLVSSVYPAPIAANMSKRTIDSFFVKPVTGNKFAKLQHPGPEISSSASLSFEHGPSHTLQTTASTTTQPKVADASATFTVRFRWGCAIFFNSFVYCILPAPTHAFIEACKLLWIWEEWRTTCCWTHSWKPVPVDEYWRLIHHLLELFVPHTALNWFIDS